MGETESTAGREELHSDAPPEGSARPIIAVLAIGLLLGGAVLGARTFLEDQSAGQSNAEAEALATTPAHLAFGADGRLYLDFAPYDSLDDALHAMTSIPASKEVQILIEDERSRSRAVGAFERMARENARNVGLYRCSGGDCTLERAHVNEQQRADSLDQAIERSLAER